MPGSRIINHPLRDEPGLKTKKVGDHSRSSVNTREVSEGSMGVVDMLGPASLVLMARCKTRKTFTTTRGRTGVYSSPATQKNKIKIEKKSQHSYSRRHRIYSSRHYPVLGRYASCVLLSPRTVTPLSACTVKFTTAHHCTRTVAVVYV